MIGCINSPTYYLAKQTHTLLQKIYKYTGRRSFENSNDFIEKLKNPNIPDTARKISFDVTYMYRHIPTQDGINIIERHLQLQGDIPTANIRELITIPKLITEKASLASIVNK